MDMRTNPDDAQWNKDMKTVFTSNAEVNIERYAREIMSWTTSLDQVTHGLPNTWKIGIIKAIRVLSVLENGKIDEESVRNLSQKDFLSIFQLKRPPRGWSEGDALCEFAYLVPDAGHYEAYGVEKGLTFHNQLDSLVYLLEEGIDPKVNIHAAPLRVGAGIGAVYGVDMDGLFILMSGKDQLLVKDGTLAVKTVLVNEAAYDMVPFLAARYPNIAFVRAMDIPRYYRMPKPPG